MKRLDSNTSRRCSGLVRLSTVVVNGYQKFRVASFKPSGKGAFAKVLDNVATHQTPELLRRDPHITFGTDYLGGMFTGAGQTNTSKTPLLGNLRIGAP